MDFWRLTDNRSMIEVTFFETPPNFLLSFDEVKSCCICDSFYFDD